MVPLNDIINKIIYYTNNLSIFENMNNKNNCKWILKSGPNKGLNCKENISENGFCKKHALKNVKDINDEILLKQDKLTNINNEILLKQDNLKNINDENLLKQDINTELCVKNSNDEISLKHINDEKILKQNINKDNLNNNDEILLKEIKFKKSDDEISKKHLKEEKSILIDDENENYNILNEILLQKGLIINKITKDDFNKLINNIEIKENIIKLIKENEKKNNKNLNELKIHDISLINKNDNKIEELIILINKFNYIYLDLKKLIINKKNINLNEIFYSSIKNQYIDILYWFKKYNISLERHQDTNLNIYLDAFNGNLENIKNKKNYFNKFLFSLIVLNGNLENMKWLKENNCPWNENTFSSAALNGNLKKYEMVKRK